MRCGRNLFLAIPKSLRRLQNCKNPGLIPPMTLLHPYSSPRSPWGKGRGAWWSLEILLTIALCVSLMSAGVIAMYQVMGVNNGLYPRNQLQQVELAKMMLMIERDFANASRAYVWDSQIQENSLGSWAPLSYRSSGVIVTGWNLNIGPANDGVLMTDGGTYLYALTAGGSSTSCRALYSDATNKYYTVILLGGKVASPVRKAVIYLTCSQTAAGVTYTLTRLEDNGSALVEGGRFTYTAPGVTFSASDQSATATTFPSITRSGAITGGVVFRFPTAFSTALKDIGTGEQARRVKYTADAWGTWTFVPGNNGKWY